MEAVEVRNSTNITLRPLLDKELATKLQKMKIQDDIIMFDKVKHWPGQIYFKSSVSNLKGWEWHL